MSSKAPNRVKLKNSFPKNTAWGRAESFNTSMVPASSSLTKERASPDKAEKVKIIHNRTENKKGLSASSMRKDPMEKLTAMRVVTANIRMAFRA